MVMLTTTHFSMGPFCFITPLILSLQFSAFHVWTASYIRKQTTVINIKKLHMFNQQPPWKKNSAADFITKLSARYPLLVRLFKASTGGWQFTIFICSVGGSDKTYLSDDTAISIRSNNSYCHNNYEVLSHLCCVTRGSELGRSSYSWSRMVFYSVSSCTNSTEQKDSKPVNRWIMFRIRIMTNITILSLN